MSSEEPLVVIVKLKYMQSRLYIQGPVCGGSRESGYAKGRDIESSRV